MTWLIYTHIPYLMETDELAMNTCTFQPAEKLHGFQFHFRLNSSSTGFCASFEAVSFPGLREVPSKLFRSCIHVQLSHVMRKPGYAICEQQRRR